MNHVNKCKSSGWQYVIMEIVGRVEKWTQHSDLTTMLELRAESRKLRMERKDDSKVISSIPIATKDKYDDAGVLVDETKLVAALISAAPKDYLSSINTQKGHLEQRRH